MRPAPLRPQQVQDREITPDGPRSKITDGVNYSNTLNHLLPLHNPIQYTVYLTPTIRTKQGITPGSKKITKRKSKHIDVHSHVVPKEMLDALSQRPERFKMRYVVDGKHRRVVRDGGGGQPVFDEFFDPAAKLAGMDRKGLDVSIISPAPIAYFLKKLKICLAHGGGYVPYQIGRFNHGHKERKETQALTKTKPNALLRRFYCDALTHDTRALRYLIDLVGADRVVIGTDAPFDMGEEHPIAMINKVKRLSAKDREQIFSKTALRLIGKRV